MQGACGGGKESGPVQGFAWDIRSLEPGGCSVFSLHRTLEDAATLRKQHHTDGETKAQSPEGADQPTVPAPKLFSLHLALGLSQWWCEELLMEGVEKQEGKGTI